MWHWSHYLHRVRNVDGFRRLAPIAGTFEKYLEDARNAERLTTFEAQLNRLKRIYWNPFNRKRLLVLVYERDVGPDLSIAYEKICQLLGIDPANFEPIKGIKSSERVETDKVVTEWSGASTFSDIKANRAYLPAVYRATSDGVSQSGDAFSAGDIIIERDASHVTVVRDPSEEELDRFLNYYDRVSLELTRDEVSDLTERYFKASVGNLMRHFGGDLPEWQPSKLALPAIERVEPSYV